MDANRPPHANDLTGTGGGERRDQPRLVRDDDGGPDRAGRLTGYREFWPRSARRRQRVGARKTCNRGGQYELSRRQAESETTRHTTVSFAPSVGRMLE